MRREVLFSSKTRHKAIYKICHSAERVMPTVSPSLEINSMRGVGVKVAVWC